MEGVRPAWAVKAILVILMTSILFRCVSVQAATNHSVGGTSGWDFDSDLQAWSSSTHFFVGDSLVFSYTPVHDVLEVNQLDFARCRTVNPIRAHSDGETVVALTEQGTRYFICGRRGHCAMGLRLRIQVLQAPNSTTTTPATPLPPPSIEGSPSPQPGPHRRRRPPGSSPPPKGNGKKSPPPPPPPSKGGGGGASPQPPQAVAPGPRSCAAVFAVAFLARVLSGMLPIFVVVMIFSSP